MNMEEFHTSMLLLGCKVERMMAPQTFGPIVRYSRPPAYAVVGGDADEHALSDTLARFIATLEKQS